MLSRRLNIGHERSRCATGYEFTSPAVPESADWKEQNLQSSPRSPRTRRAMKQRRGSLGVYTEIDF